MLLVEWKWLCDVTFRTLIRRKSYCCTLHDFATRCKKAMANKSANSISKKANHAAKMTQGTWGGICYTLRVFVGHPLNGETWTYRSNRKITTNGMQPLENHAESPHILMDDGTDADPFSRIHVYVSWAVPQHSLYEKFLKWSQVRQTSQKWYRLAN